MCDVCKQLDEEDFRRVKDYLYKNSGANLTQVSIDLDVSVEKIKRFLKDGRLEIVAEDGNMFLDCEKCGKSIKSGKFCEECGKNITSDFKTMASRIKGQLDSSEAAKKAIGMRYLNKDKKD